MNHPRLLLGVLLISGFSGGCSLLNNPATAHRAIYPATDSKSTPSNLPAPPRKQEHRVGQYVFYSDIELDTSHDLFRELERLPEQISQELKVPRGSNFISVYLFETQSEYESYIRAHHPDLPLRRAYFFAQHRGGGLPVELEVVTWLGPQLRTDLRHELTHALLHDVLKSVPLWLDEGLAGYFEQDPSNQGVNDSHLLELLERNFQPDLARLEKLSEVAQMEKGEYQEAWAWVHFMLRGHPQGRALLLEYLQQLRKDKSQHKLASEIARLIPHASAKLRTYLKMLGEQRYPSAGNATISRH